MKINIDRETQNELIKRLLISFGILFVIRMGSLLPIPAIDHNELIRSMPYNVKAKSLVSMFSAKDTFVIGVFELNIFPYINASILVQLILAFSPKLTKLQKEGDLEGRRLINRLTRFITLLFSILQSLSIVIYVKQALPNWNYSLALEIMMWLTTGAMIVFWLSELITDYGLGNGIQLLIYANISSNLPTMGSKLGTTDTENFDYIGSVIVLGLLILIELYGIVLLQKVEKIIPLMSSKQLNKSSLTDIDNYLPLRLNQAGVLPIILTTSLLVVSGYTQTLGLLPKSSFAIKFDSFNPFYWIANFVLIVVFSSFYSNVIVNPKDVSDQLQKMSVTIPGIRPGLKTTFYLKKLMNRLTVIGSTMLATLVTVPNFIESKLNIPNLNGLTTTSLVILAGVLIDVLNEMNNIYFSSIYKKFQ